MKKNGDWPLISFKMINFAMSNLISMKRHFISFLIALVAICGTCISCFTTLALMSASSSANADDISKDKVYLNLKIIQTLDEGQALARTEKFDIVKIESTKDVYYDGKTIKGNFTRVSTYTYVTREGYTKTVPVFVLTSEYKDLMRL